MKDIIHDCFVDLNDERPESYQVAMIMKEIPNDIITLAKQWGWNDTEVRDKVYLWMKERFK
jgi:hypothetical protein